MHKIPVFWKFHAVHHSQSEMNLFTSYRVHILEHLFAYSIVFIPMMSFKVPVIDSVVCVFLQQWYSIIYHANLKTNYGPLRYFLVTPQSHRMHHSLQSEHHNRNFGTLFSIWDRIFGTQVENHRDYCTVGVKDFSFPQAKNYSLIDYLHSFMLQNIYTFKIYFLKNRK
jgi:sterol desaturase/sphingolipid hydroxylase (fatty acid hydroxylase superfamily)